jgi:hypothetical protein
MTLPLVPSHNSVNFFIDGPKYPYVKSPPSKNHLRTTTGKSWWSSARRRTQLRARQGSRPMVQLQGRARTRARQESGLRQIHHIIDRICKQYCVLARCLQ